MKKRKIINFLSTLFGVTALCGLFALSSYDYKQIETTNAETTINMVNGSGTYTGDTYTQHYEDTYDELTADYSVTFKATYNYKYYKYLSGGDLVYQFSIDIIFSFDVTTSNRTGTDWDEYGNLLTEGTYYIAPNNITEPYTYTLYSELYDVNVYNFEFDFNGFYFSNFYYKFQDSAVSNSVGYLRMLNNQFVGSSEVVIKNLYSNSTTNIQILSDVLTYVNDDYNEGYTQGYTNGFTEGYNEGLNSGTNTGYAQGVLDGKEEQYAEDSLLFTQYYNTGYATGFADGQDDDAVTTSVINGILQVGFVPVNFFLSIMNFELLGINIKGLVTAILTIGLVLVIWRVIINGKSE